MPDNANLMEEIELSLDKLIADAHKRGLNYWIILRICLIRCIDLMMQSQAEYYQKGGR